MANLTFIITDSNRKRIFTGSVVAKKMTTSFMKQHYGADWNEYYDAMYFCHKNPYGLTWLIKQKGRFDETYCGYCDNPAKATIKLPGGLGNNFYFYA